MYIILCIIMYVSCIYIYVCIENIYMTSAPPTITFVQLTKPDTAYITWSHTIFLLVLNCKFYTKL